MRKTDRSDAPVSIRLPASIDNLPGFIGPVLAFATANQLGEERKNDLELALEEALVNIFRYAYPGGTGYVGLSCRIADGRLVLLIEDEGLPFAATSAGPPDISAGILERKIGGLGIHLIKNLMDDVRYRREGDRNLLELTLSLTPRQVAR